MKNLKSIIFSFLSGLLGAWTLLQFMGSAEIPINIQENHRFFQVGQSEDISKSQKENLNPFVGASEKSVKSVVFIKAFAGRDPGEIRMFRFFFGQNPPPRINAGSGVIFSSDGYIITNKHVIDGADTVQVIYQDESFSAEVIGTDSNTDMAILKIDSSNLPAIKQGKSQNLKAGDWVLAVGNPFNLTSTVTSGIVSAVERELDILDGEFPLKSFIQTDAPINQGNSGGALVNTDGELVGIATAIVAGRGGTVTGFGFAVPGDIAIKVANDLIQYGYVRKAVSGAEVEKINPEMIKRMQLKTSKGVIVTNLLPEGAAERAGIRQNDVIYQVDGHQIIGKGNFENLFSYYQPGDQVKVNFQRGKELKSTTLTLQELSSSIISKSSVSAHLSRFTSEKQFSGNIP